MERRAILSCALALLFAGCGILPPVPPSWQVDVANADRPLIVSISTDRAAWLWLVPANARIVLLREPLPLQGSIELIDPESCTAYDKAALVGTSFTIVPQSVAGPVRDFGLRLDPGAESGGPPSEDFTANCSSRAESPPVSTVMGDIRRPNASGAPFRRRRPGRVS